MQKLISPIKLIVLLLGISISIGSCKKSNTQNPDGGNPNAVFKTVYSAGFSILNNGNPIATIWKNDTAIKLTDGTKQAIAKGIVVVGNDIYIAGYEGTTAKYWKNGVATNLNTGTTNAIANAIFVSGTDVYIAGRENNFAKYWKNGVAVNLTNGTNVAEATSIMIDGANVYVAGYELNVTGKNVAKYWKNGVATTLTDGNNRAWATSIIALGADVYVVGYEEYNALARQTARFWKNGVLVPLADALTNTTNGGSISSAYAITRNGSDIYIAGHANVDVNSATAKGRLWKNGVVASVLNDAISYGNAVALGGSDVYVGGQSAVAAFGGGIATYWKNGTPVILTKSSLGETGNVYSIALGN